ncbi:MAG: ATP-dependent zinc metalloprotease FtsH [Muribaculaceae bacterium]|nr:ATP-dependent zinc metalloprotease FtsH [Muribaculaceae bacterium]
MDNNLNNKDKKPQGKGKMSFSIYWMYGIIAIVLFGIYYAQENSVGKEVGWSELESYALQGGVKNIVVDGKTVKAELTDSLAKVVFGKDAVLANGAKAHVSAEAPSRDRASDKIDQWRAAGKFNGQVKFEESGGFMSFLFSFGPILLLVALWYFIMKRMSGGAGGPGGVFSVGKSKAKLFDKDNNTNVTFKDVAGLQEAKTEVAEIVDFLKNPQIYTELGGKIPKGALLVGPPGTGKTLLAKAVAGEANVPFFSLSGSDFVEMFVGVGASRVRDLFRQAKEKAPCIVFIDEIDAVGRARGKNPNMGTNDERESTLNQLLTEMDGFGTNSGVIILAATNRADILDKALLRAGRFDRQIYVELPDLNGRRAIFNVHLAKIKKDESVDVDLLARQTPGFSGADIANVCNEAALIAARHKKKIVQRQDFMDAIDRIIGGLEKKTKITTMEERRSIAVHEGGHAVVSWHLQYADPLVKVTIVPRGNALGAAHYLPEERQIMPTQALLDKLCSLLGGRAAEEKFLGCISTGAMNDLERATNMAYAIVVYYGMSERLPNISYYDSTGQNYGFTKPYSEERARVIDEEVSRIIAEQYERAKEILSQHEEGHRELTDVLLTREVIFTDDVERIFGKRPWHSRTEEIMEVAADEKKEPATDNAEENGDEVTPPPFKEPGNEKK